MFRKNIISFVLLLTLVFSFNLCYATDNDNITLNTNEQIAYNFLEKMSIITIDPDSPKLIACIVEPYKGVDYYGKPHKFSILADISVTNRMGGREVLGCSGYDNSSPNDIEILTNPPRITFKQEDININKINKKFRIAHGLE